MLKFSFKYSLFITKYLNNLKFLTIQKKIWKKKYLKKKLKKVQIYSNFLIWAMNFQIHSLNYFYFQNTH